MFIAVVEDAKTLSDTPSATYAYYHSNIKPKPAEKTTEQTVWRCRVCGYEYKGEKLPDDFICLYASTPHRTLRRYKKDRISGLFHCSDFV